MSKEKLTEQKVKEQSANALVKAFNIETGKLVSGGGLKSAVDVLQANSFSFLANTLSSGCKTEYSKGNQYTVQYVTQNTLPEYLALLMAADKEFAEVVIAKLPEGAARFVNEAQEIKKTISEAAQEYVSSGIRNAEAITAAKAKEANVAINDFACKWVKCERSKIMPNSPEAMNIFSIAKTLQDKDFTKFYDIKTLENFCKTGGVGSGKAAGNYTTEGSLNFKEFAGTGGMPENLKASIAQEREVQKAKGFGVEEEKKVKKEGSWEKRLGEENSQKTGMLSKLFGR